MKFILEKSSNVLWTTDYLCHSRSGEVYSLNQLMNLLKNNVLFIWKAHLTVSKKQSLLNSAPGTDAIPFSPISDASLMMIKRKDLTPTPSDLRPISIPNSLIRIVQHWVANSFAPLARLIHDVQSAFLPGRDIRDNNSRKWPPLSSLPSYDHTRPFLPLIPSKGISVIRGVPLLSITLQHPD
jgi:hypothetical protein